MTAMFMVYEDAAGEWRWRLVAGNGEPIADSGEGYDTKANALRAIDTVRELVTVGEVRS
jgi:uncharacterized protein YegP (UPF0339 family)